MTTTDVYPASPVDTEALHAALEAVLSSYFGVPRAVTDMERRMCAYSSSFLIEELDVTLDDGVCLEMVLKDVSPSALTDQTRWVKPAFLYHAEREIEVYRSLLAPAQLGTATYYGAVTSRTMKRYWLFLERVPGIPLWQIGAFEQWEEVARRLAVMHTRLQRERKRSAACLDAMWLRYDEAYYRRWMRRAVRIVRRKDPALMDTLKGVVGTYGALVERLLALPTTFLHGEFYPSNVLVQQEAEGLRICPVDWEVAALGPALMDLSALTSGTWTSEQQVAMATAYREGLIDEGRQPGEMDELLEGLAYCRLFQALTWVGWSLRWEPPPEHARNWLHEAATLAESLAL